MSSRPDQVTTPAQHLADAAGPTLEQIREDAEGKSPRVAMMLDYLDSHLFEPGLNVATWKEATDVRDNSVAIEFHGTVGTPPKLYINEKRCEVAGRLLISTDLAVWRIADLIGFSSLGVFSKAFARMMALRPSAYRRVNRSRARAPHTFTTDTLRRALAGSLPETEARALVEAILCVYPGLALDL